MIEINDVNNEDLDFTKINNLAQSFLDAHNLSKKLVSIAFISEEEMKMINYKYRGKNANTDVLSFSEDGDSDYLGEILINYDKIKGQATYFKNTPEKELDFILIHGLLHLLGYTDDKEEDKKEMIRLGNKFLKNYYNK